ncbi:glycosyltransferase family 1 protein [Paraflavisolibacter sp. H34]|uniref:glycosyltransferase family 4 protein n=1 Tax=Huijunlia imazamoxiresistens TaxID=3127457 RepID=UPI00301AC8D5
MKEKATSSLVKAKPAGRKGERKPGPEVVLVFRKPLPSTHSIEYLFHNIYEVLRERSAVREWELPCFSTGLLNRVRNLFSLFRFRNKIIHITGDCYYAVLGAWFCKRILTVHDLSFLDRTTGWRRAVLRLFWVRLPVRFAHKVTVVSLATQNVLLRETKALPRKVRVITNFIDPVYQPVTRTFNARCPRILQVGTAFNKNIPLLAKALEGMDCTLMIIGRLSRQQEEALLTCGIRYQNRCSLPLSELHREYLAADLLAFVSTVEGFGMPILEAQATGLPVVTSNCSSMPEVAGKGALFVDPFDPASIRRGFLEIIADGQKREQLVCEGLLNVQRFSKQKIAEDYRALYQSFFT